VTAFDPGVAEAQQRLLATMPQPAPLSVGGTRISIGTASWTDPTLTARGVFYPDGARSPEGRLRHYASLLSMAEIDASYYALPSADNAERWVERTPDHFVFDVKAFALMTGHGAEVARLPSDIREALPAELAGEKRVSSDRLPTEIVDEVWRRFHEAVLPLFDAGKLGAVLMQYPPWVGPTRESPAMLERARDRLGALPIAVELRNARWMSPRLAERTFAMLRSLGMTYVVVDEPQGMASSVPPVVAVTTPELAIVRFHGHRTELWERRGVPAVEKYRYLYSVAELERWAARILELAGSAERLHLVYNNCYANYGVCNALEIGALLAAGEPLRPPDSTPAAP
jgi:uncharacterized protein YecE (DUF72 family)